MKKKITLLLIFILIINTFTINAAFTQGNVNPAYDSLPWTGVTDVEYHPNNSVVEEVYGLPSTIDGPRNKYIASFKNEKRVSEIGQKVGKGALSAKREQVGKKIHSLELSLSELESIIRDPDLVSIEPDVPVHLSEESQGTVVATTYSTSYQEIYSGQVQNCV